MLTFNLDLENLFPDAFIPNMEQNENEQSATDVTGKHLKYKVFCSERQLILYSKDCNVFFFPT